MRPHLLVVPLVLLMLVSGCAKSDQWPQGVHSGQRVSVNTLGESGISRAKVLRIEGGWLIAEYRGETVMIPRDKVVWIVIHNE